MERLPADVRCVRIVEVIADQRVAQILHVDADLVGAPGFKVEQDKAVIIPVAGEPVMGDGLFAVYEIHRPLDDGAGLS